MHKRRGPRKSKRKPEQWVCYDFPNCTCGRVTEYSTKPLHRYSARANDRFAITDSFVVLCCMADHAPDREVRIDALCQLMRPKYRSCHEELPWLLREAPT